MQTKTFLAAAFLFMSELCAAEILHNIEPLDSLGDIKKKYPNAQLTKVKAAWVTEDQEFMSLRGVGFPGLLYVAFSDNRPLWRTTAQEQKALRPAGDTPSVPTIAENLSKESDDNALTVDWVRWVPQSAIPLERYKSKYGEPTKCDFRQDTMAPYCEWPALGLSVALSDDRKMVLNAEASFTMAELRKAYLKKHGYLPDYLKDDTAAPAKVAKPDDKKTPVAKKP